MTEDQHSQLLQLINQLRQENEDINLEEMRQYAVKVVLEEYGDYMYPGIRALPLDQPIKIKNNLHEMGCDGGFDPIPPQQIEFDMSLNPLEQFTSLMRAAIQFYAYSGPTEVQLDKGLYTRWGFVHLDQTGQPRTKLYGLHQDTVRYLTDQICMKLGIGVQSWMQRGDSSHIRQLVENQYIGEDLLLRAFFDEAFPEFVGVINSSGIMNRLLMLGELSDQIDNSRLCEFPIETIKEFEKQYTETIQSIGV